MKTIAVGPSSYLAVRALGKDQVGLAGMGALSGLPYGSQILYRPPGTANRQVTQHHQPRVETPQQRPVPSQVTPPRYDDDVIHDQPILKPLNVAQHEDRAPPGAMNDLNQPGPQTIPIRTNDKYNVRPQRPTARGRQHPGEPQRSGPPPRPAGSHPGQPYALPEELYEFPRERLNLRQRIGDGLYGEVWRARADGILGRREQIVVAVKMLKGEHCVVT